MYFHRNKDFVAGRSLTCIAAIVALGALFCACSSRQNTLRTTPAFDSAVVHADRLYDSGYKTRALETVMAAHSTIPRLTVMDEMNYYTYCGEVYRKDYRNNDKYIAYADSIMQVLEREKLTKQLSGRYIQALNMKADAFFAIGLYSESYNYYFRAKKLAGENNDSCAMSQYNYSLGMVLYKQQRFLSAVKDFIEAFNETSSCNDKFNFFYRRQELLDNIGLCYYHARKYDSAMHYYQWDIAFIDSNFMHYDKRKSVYASAKAVVYGNMADLYTVAKQYDTAITLLKQSIGINLQKGYANSDAMVDQVKLAKLYQSMNDNGQLRALLGNIEAELDSIPDQQVKMSLNRLMSQYYDHVNKDSAYLYLQAYTRLNDSLTANNKAMMSTDVNGMISGIERQYQLRRLDEEAFEQKVYLAIAAVIVAMAIIIVVLMLGNIRRSRDSVRALTAMNHQVRDQKEKLQAAFTELERKDRDKLRVLRAASHDMLNPIAAISGLVDIINFDAENLTAEQQELMALIKETCENSISLSRDILEAATTAEKHGANKERVNINKLVVSCVDLLGAKAAQKHQHILLEAEEANIEAVVNKEKIWRVLNNLIGNAIKFSYENSDINVRLRRTDGKIEISVQDNGVGIPEKNKPYIFNVFSEARMPGTAGEVPHGLGLSVSLQIAKAHGGNIWFESEEGKGSIFHLAIPADAPPAKQN